MEPDPLAMRWSLPAAVLLAIGPFALAGCLGSPGGVFAGVHEDCSTSESSLVAVSADVIFPGSVPEDVKAEFGTLPRITVHAREGQNVQAVAAWAPMSGLAEVAYDGPRQDRVETSNSWTSFGEVHEGNYTLELQGAPMAFEVVYSLYLSASGCTPIP
jgi:hypothetical protein